MPSLQEILYVLEPLDYIVLTMSILCYIPSVILTRYYMKTKITDYLLFTGIYLPFSVNLQLFILNQFLQQPIYYQINHFLLNISLLCILLHVLRIKESSYNTIVGYIGKLWFLILQVMIFFWIDMEPQRSRVLFFVMNPHPIITEAIPGFTMGLSTQSGTIIYSSSHPLLALLFYVLVYVTWIYNYLTIEPLIDTVETRKVRRNWLIVGWIYLLTNIEAIVKVISQVSEDIVALMVMANLVLVAITCIRYREAVLLTQYQVRRALYLYKSTEIKGRDPGKEADTYNKIKRYLEEASLLLNNESSTSGS